jgi:hypothetical protein
LKCRGQPASREIQEIYGKFYLKVVMVVMVVMVAMEAVTEKLESLDQKC